jgi:hypothetical protein
MTKKPRFAHFHEGTLETGRGRLVATIATYELDDGTIAVGVSRCGPEDRPVRHIGRQIAAARLERLTARLTGGTADRTAQRVYDDADALLCMHMTRDAFMRKVIKDGALRKLALANDRLEVLDLMDDLRAHTIPLPQQ